MLHMEKAKQAFPHMLELGVVLTLLLAVACGAAATATPAPTAAPAATAVPAATVAPTAAPTASVISGKVTWLTGGLANERMHNCLTTGGSIHYGAQIHDYLIKSDVKNGQLVLVPGVATDWGISADGRTWTFTIRKGVKWHDGTELTPEDVYWNWKFSFGPGADVLTGTCVDKSAQMEDITMDGQMVSVTHKSPTGDFAYLMSDAGGHWLTVHPAYLNRQARDNLYDEQALAAYDKNPVGAGIFKLVGHELGVSMLMERFDDYFYQPANGLPKDLRPRFATLELRLVPEEATRVAAIRAGEADIAPVSLAAKGQVEAGGGRVVFGPEGVFLYGLMLGCWEGAAATIGLQSDFPCADKRVRQALLYALDLETMADQLWGPGVFEAKGWSAVTPSTIGYAPDLDPFPFDPGKARALLKEAGYRVPGSQEGKEFGKLIVNTWVSAAAPLLPESAQLAAEFWNRELGIDVEVKLGDVTAIMKEIRLTPDHYGEIVWRDNETRIDASKYIFLTAFGQRNPEQHWRSGNDPELWAVADAAYVVTDPEEQPKAWHDAYAVFRDSAHMMGLGIINIPWGVGPRVIEWQPKPLAFYPSALHTIVLK